MMNVVLNETRKAVIEFEMVQTHDEDIDPKDDIFSGEDEYYEQEMSRLQAYYRDEWDYVGIQAKATIKIPHGTNLECWITSEMLSPGLWGVESDSDPEYINSVYQEEKETLLGMLESLKDFQVAS